MKRFQHALALVGILLIAFLLRLPLLSASLWLDEAAQALESARPLSQQFNIVDDFQPPLLHLLTYALLHVSTAEWWLRLGGAVIPGLATIFFTWLIAKRVTGQQYAWIPPFLLAISSLHIFYSQELRPYSLPTFFAVLSWWLLLQAKKQRWHSALLIMATSLGWYSSFLYPFVTLGQLFYLAAQKPFPGWKKLVPLLLGSATFIFWLPIFRLQLAAGGTVREGLPGWQDVVGIPPMTSLLLVWGKFVFGVVDLQLNAFYVGISLLLLTIIGWWMLLVFRQQIADKKEGNNQLLLALCWLIIPLVAIWGVSWFIPILQPKRVLFLLPGAYIVGVQWWQSALTATSRKTQKYILHSGAAVFALLLALSIRGTFQYFTLPALQREDWRSLHAQITTQYPTDSVAVFSFPAPFAPWEWYDDGTYPTLTTGALSVTSVPDLTTRLSPVTEYRTVLVFDYLRDLSDPQDQISDVLRTFGFSPITTISRPGIGEVHVWSRFADRLSYARM